MWFKKKEIVLNVSDYFAGDVVTVYESMPEKEVCAGDSGIVVTAIWGPEPEFYTWVIAKMDFDGRLVIMPDTNLRHKAPMPKKKRTKKVKK